jgi:hypothetical protein
MRPNEGIANDQSNDRKIRALRCLGTSHGTAGGYSIVILRAYVIYR